MQFLASWFRRRGAGTARRIGCTTLAALAILGCRDERLPPDRYLRIVHRFAAPPADPARPVLAYAPTASIRDGTRYVLAAPPLETLSSPAAVAPGASVVRLAPVLPAAWQGVRSVVVIPRLQVETLVTDLPPRVVATERSPQGTIARFDVELPPREAKQDTQLAAVAYAEGLADLATQRMPAIEIPEAAWLEFAIGVVESRYGFDLVEFEIQACRDDVCRRLFRELVDPRDERGSGWQNRRISLAALAGTRQQLVFQTRRKSELAPFSFPVWANPTLYAEAPRSPEQSNVILISIDTLRADHLTPYGYHRDTSPFMAERFGKHGTLFEHLVASATITSPSHASIFTSLQPVTHQVTEGMMALPFDVTTLAEIVRNNGIKTGAVTENGWLSVNFGFGRGFDRFRELKSASLMFATGQVDATFDGARRWLAWHRDKQFLLFLHTYQVHSPYAPPRAYARLFREGDGRRSDEEVPPHLRAMDAYDREIRYTDDELRGLFESLDELGLTDDTVVIVTSDHGEAFLERGLLEHGGFLTEEMVRVPLMLWGPGIPAGKRIRTPASHVDLMPTVLELLGLPTPSPSQGVSLLATIRSAEPDPALAARPLFSESPAIWATGADHRPVGFRGPAYLVRQGDRKLARYPTEHGVEYRYYDLASDPREQTDLYPAHAAQAADLVELLESNLAHGAALRNELAAQASGADTPVRRPELDAQQAEKLRALGYLR